MNCPTMFLGEHQCLVFEMLDTEYRQPHAASRWWSVSQWPIVITAIVEIYNSKKGTPGTHFLVNNIEDRTMHGVSSHETSRSHRAQLYLPSC